MRFPRTHYLGRDVADASGQVLGQVVDTFPFDGGGELDMVVIRLRRFGERRMLPAAELRLEDGLLIAPFTRVQIEDSPDLGEGRHAADDPWRAKTYWHWEEPAVYAPGRGAPDLVAPARRGRPA